MLMCPLNALATRENMLNIIGPMHSSSLVLSSLATCENKLHWAVNTYFRNKFITDLPNDSQLTGSEHINLGSETHNYYVPRLPCSQQQYPVICFPSEQVPKHNMAHIPLEIVQKIMFYLDFKSVYLWYSTSKLQKSVLKLLGNADVVEASLSSVSLTESDVVESVWLKQLEYRSFVIPKNCKNSIGLMIGGRPPQRESKNSLNTSGIHQDHKMMDSIGECNHIEKSKQVPLGSCPSNQWYRIGDNAHELNSYELFRLYYSAEHSSTCMHCKEISSVVPVVYGFPSQALVNQYRRKKLQMGGDYLMEGTAAFMCLSCSVQFFSYPYKCCEIAVPQ